ncbi:MAG: hypothetical protein P9L94_16825 [Candidatus Hinthialibacter antarcticus]|nr:hypothetical protein [Candidatus Hinthialibacter antarcticus]
MVALFVLFVGAVLCVYYRDECLDRFPVAHFFVLTAAIVWAAFSIQDGYVCELLLPSMIAGLLLYFQRPENPKYALGGTCVFLLITWLLLFSPPSYQETLFPSLQQPEAINEQFVMASSGSVIDEYTVSPAIFPAEPLKSSLLFVCLCLTIVLLFIITFRANTTSARNVFLLFLFIVCTGFTLLFGYQPAWIGGLCALLFSVFISTEVWTWKSKAVVIILGGVLAGCALISIQIPLLSSTPLPQLDWYWQARNSDNQSWGTLGVFQPLSTLGTPISIFATFIIAGCIFVLLVRRSIGFEKSDVIFPACIVLLLTAGAGAYSAVESMIAHPLLWLGLSLLYPKNEERENSKARDENLDLEIPLPIWKRPEASAAAGLLLLLTLITYSYLNVQRTYNLHFNEFLGEKIVSQRNLLLDELREIAPYRPEGAALYAMHHLRTAIESNRMPDEQTIQKIELALTTCARYDVAPLFAYKRLSDVYLIRADSSRALQTFERAVQAFPYLVVLRELYADLLGTVGKYDQAIIQYKIASNLEPASSRIREKISLVYKSLGKTIEFQEENDKFQMLSPPQSSDMD